MNILGWIRHALFLRRPPALEAVEAREVAQRLGERADQLNAHLQKYSRARDPFAAFMADLYNRDQMTKMHRGSE